MLYDKFYDSEKFKSIKEAKGHVFTVNLVNGGYFGRFEIITPKGKKHYIDLIHEPRAGVDILDDRELQGFIAKLIKKEALHKKESDQ